MTSKKDYEAVATVISRVVEAYDYPPVSVMEVARGLAEYFAADNPRFDRARFLGACEFFKKAELFK